MVVGKISTKGKGKIRGEVMKGKKKKLLALFIITLLAAGLQVPVYGAGTAKTVTISVPTYPIVVNGVKIDLGESKYPFIVYNDITYFPMTYNDCRVLGLETQWKGNGEGLVIEKTGITAAYLAYPSLTTNRGSYKATVATFPIKVNGKVVDNSKQQYPILSFRDITYFPMTWEFGVNEFGWDYSFSPREGLIIKSDNPKLEQTSFGGSDVLKDDDGKISSITVTKKYIYYQGKRGQIIQAPLLDPTKTKTVYQLPTYDVLYYVRLYVENGEAHLFYHTGGAIMGADHIFRLNDDGSTTELQNGYNRVKAFGDEVFTYWTGHTPGSGNLFRKVGEEDIPVGDRDYLYGWSWRVESDGMGGSGSNDVVLDGENLYILAFNRSEGATEKNGIYRVNINTNKTVRMSGHEAMGFQQEGDYLYYVSEGALYRIFMKDGNEELVKRLTQLSDEIPSFAVINEKVYWEKAENEGLYDDDGKNVNDGAVLEGMRIAGDQNEYLICTFEETELSKYRIMIFDKSGVVVFKTSDTTRIDSIDIAGATVTFANWTTGTICSARLK